MNLPSTLFDQELQARFDLISDGVGSEILDLHPFHLKGMLRAPEFEIKIPIVITRRRVREHQNSTRRHIFNLEVVGIIVTALHVAQLKLTLGSPQQFLGTIFARITVIIIGKADFDRIGVGPLGSHCLHTRPCQEQNESSH